MSSLREMLVHQHFKGSTQQIYRSQKSSIGIKTWEGGREAYTGGREESRRYRYQYTTYQMTAYGKGIHIQGLW